MTVEFVLSSQPLAKTNYVAASTAVNIDSCPSTEVCMFRRSICNLLPNSDPVRAVFPRADKYIGRAA